MFTKGRNNARRNLVRCTNTIAMLGLYGLLVGDAAAQENQGSDLAKQLSNPISSLISVPFQVNYDRGIGSADGHRTVLNIQPVIPISLNDDWNLISRTIVPIVWQDDIAGESGYQSGLGDALQSFFFSPSESSSSGITWGVGPAILLPTATNDLLGSGKWAAGPTAVVLRQQGPWTYGILANHVWSFAGDGDRRDVSSTFMQPFLSYTTPSAWTFSLNSESSYDWIGESWSVPINVQIAKLVHFGDQPVSFQAGVRYWASSPDSGPSGFGLRGAVTFLFPS